MAAASVSPVRFQPTHHFPAVDLLPDALASTASAGRARFGVLGLPERRLESWRFTPLDSIVNAAYEVAPDTANRGVQSPWTLPTGPRLVFVNGHLDAAASRLDAAADGVVVTDLYSAARTHPQLVAEHLGTSVVGDDDAFAALNSAVLQNGAFIHVGPECSAGDPVHIVLLSSDDGAPTVAYPRNLLVLEQGSSARVVVSHAHAGNSTLSLPMLEASLGVRSRLDLVVVADESDGASMVSSWHVHQQAESRFEAQLVAMGGPLVRHDINVRIDGEGAHCELQGLYLPRADQVVDTHVRIEHASPGATSAQRFHGILDDRARAVFNGSVIVEPDAQKTDATQSNRNLLLSDSARVHSNPQLEIFADDVRCTHGSAIGRLDGDAIFYLRSRGISRAEAEAILVHAFAAEITASIAVPAVRQVVDRLLARRLPVGESLLESS